MNCCVLGTVVITPRVFGLMAEGATGGSVAVGDIFNSPDLIDVCDGLGPQMTSDLQSGNYYITNGGETASYVVYLAGTTNPVTLQNLDFAFKVFK